MPRIRFKEFSERWEPKSIGDILEVKHGKDYKKCKQNNKSIPVMGTGGIITYIDDYLCNWNCVCIGRKGTINKPIYMDKPFWAVDTLFFTKPKLNNVPKFQYYLFQNIEWLLYNEASGVPSLSSSTIEKIKINVPQIEEQNKLSKFFTLIDQQIEQRQQLIEHLKSYKRGLENHIFSKEYTTHYCISEILIEYSEHTKTNNQFPIISSTKQGLFLQCEYFNKQAASIDTTGYKILKHNQIVFSPQNLWMGNINFNNKFDIGIVSPSYKIYNIESQFNPLYIGYLLKSSCAIKEFISASEQGASIVRRNLNMTLFEAISFSIPSFELQNKYAMILHKLDTQIEKFESILTRLLNIKYCLLQQLFI